MSRPEFVIFAHSGEYDRLYQVATLAASAAANGEDVHIILFFQALRRFVEDDLDNPAFPASYGEDGPLIEQRMRESRAHSVGELIDTARQLGKLTVYGCAAQIKFMGFTPGEVEEVVDEVISLPNFLRRDGRGPDEIVHIKNVELSSELQGGFATAPECVRQISLSSIAV